MSFNRSEGLYWVLSLMISRLGMLTSRGKKASAANFVNVVVESLQRECFRSTMLALNDIQDAFLITDFI